MAKEKEDVTPREVRRTYETLMRDWRWLKFSDELKERRGYECEICGLERSETRCLQAHHLGYLSNRLPWEYPDEKMLVVCDECHHNIHDHADKLWNKALESRNQWVIYECLKAVKETIEKHERDRVQSPVDPEDVGH